MTTSIKSMKRIHNVTVRRINDCNPDTSYLEQEGFEKRLDEYNRGHFEFVGIRRGRGKFPNVPKLCADTESDIRWFVGDRE